MELPFVDLPWWMILPFVLTAFGHRLLNLLRDIHAYRDERARRRLPDASGVNADLDPKRK